MADATGKSAQGYGVPILILKEGTARTRGKDAQSMNIAAAKAVASAVRTTLGPKGMDKMLVDTTGDITVTNDGATILKEMDIEHPAAKMIVEVAKTQDEEVGDGTTTAAVLAGELLKQAEELLEQEVHSTIIANGYRFAAKKAREMLESFALPVTPDDGDLLLKLAATAISGKSAEFSKEKVAGLAVDAVRLVMDEKTGKVSTDDIKVEKCASGSIDDSELIRGMVLDKERAHTGMPKKAKDAKILVLNEALEVKKTETKAEIRIKTPEQMQAFLDQEEQMHKDKVSKIVSSGANVVFSHKGMDDLAVYYLSKAGVFAVKNVSDKDSKKIAKATGARVVMSLDAFSDTDIGSADAVEERKLGEKKLVFITGCPDPKAVSILLRGGSEHVIKSLENTITDAIRVAQCAIEDGKYVPGGGAPEVELSLRIREYAATLRGREQLAVEKFAEAIEVIPRTLAENAGLDPVDTLIEIRSRHEKGDRNVGLDVYSGDVVDMLALGVIEPLRVKTQAVTSAVDAATMILRIDDVISAGKEKMPPMPPPGGEMY